MSKKSEERFWKNIQLNENKNVTSKSRDGMKTVFRGKFVAPNVHIRKEEGSSQ